MEMLRRRRGGDSWPTAQVHSWDRRSPLIQVHFSCQRWVLMELELSSHRWQKSLGSRVYPLPGLSGISLLLVGLISSRFIESCQIRPSTNNKKLIPEKPGSQVNLILGLWRLLSVKSRNLWSRILQITVYNQEWLTIDCQGTNLPRSIQSFMDISTLSPRRFRPASAVGLRRKCLKGLNGFFLEEICSPALRAGQSVVSKGLQAY